MAISTVQAIINGQTYTLTYNSSSGKYEATITAPTQSSFNVNAGHYYPVTVKVTDVAGNITTKDDTDSTLGASLKLDVTEKVAPTVTITSPGASAKLVNNKPTITFQLRDADSGVNISTLSLKIDGGATIVNTASGMTCTAVTGGYDCSYVIQTALGEGSHTITIGVSDNDGNVANAGSVTFTIDTVPPVLNITAPANNLVTNQATCTVTGTTNDVTSSPVTATIKLNNVDQGAVSITSGSFTKAITLAQGANTIVIRSTDGSGQYTEVTRTVTLDTTPPTITAIELIPNPVDAGATFVIKVTASDV